MSRIYAATSLAHLHQLAAGQPIEVEVVAPESDDEEHEYEALLSAAEQGSVVISAEVDRANAPIRPQDVQSFHLDADGSGDLAWYAPQELDQVIGLLESAGPPIE